MYIIYISAAEATEVKRKAEHAAALAARQQQQQQQQQQQGHHQSSTTSRVRLPDTFYSPPPLVSVCPFCVSAPLSSTEL
eukprot:COSAG01_NODE_2904_length_6887_cov_2.857543_6_plen_79_part_00